MSQLRKVDEEDKSEQARLEAENHESKAEGHESKAEGQGT